MLKASLGSKNSQGEIKKKTTTFVGSFGNLGKQTLASSVKTRSILKNNFGQMPVYNNKFIPVNKTEAKDQIFRTVDHDHEVNKNNDDLMHSGSINVGSSGIQKDGKRSTARDGDSIFNKDKNLNDPFFASRLEKMSKLSLGKQMYNNDPVAERKKKEALYDY